MRKTIKTRELDQADVYWKPIIYGNSATQLGKSDENTHQWTVYVRSPKNEDLSLFIRKVVFKLHESFNNHIRTVETAPFEITEAGWGEFEVNIRIFFVDPQEKPVSITHFLKLFPSEDTVSQNKKTIVSERYDEIVFLQPSDMMISALGEPTVGLGHGARDYDKEEEKQMQALDVAKLKVQSLLQDRQAKQKDLEEQIRVLKAELEGQLEPAAMEQ